MKSRLSGRARPEKGAKNPHAVLLGAERRPCGNTGVRKPGQITAPVSCALHAPLLCSLGCVFDSQGRCSRRRSLLFSSHLVPVPPQEGPGRTHYNPHLPGLQAGKSSFRPGAQDGVRRILRRTPLNTVQRFLLKISKIWLHPSSSMGSSAAAGGVWTGSDPAFPLWAGAASCSAFFSPAAVKGLLFIAPG